MEQQIFVFYYVDGKISSTMIKSDLTTPFTRKEIAKEVSMKLPKSVIRNILSNEKPCINHIIHIISGTSIFDILDIEDLCDEIFNQLTYVFSDSFDGFSYSFSEASAGKSYSFSEACDGKAPSSKYKFSEAYDGAERQILLPSVTLELVSV